MGSRFVVAALLLCSCKAELGGGDGVTSDAAASADANRSVQVDAAIDGQAALGAWGTPAAIPGANTPNVGEDDGTLSSNKLELYFKRNDVGAGNLYVMTRASVTSAWGAPTALTVVNTAVTEESPRLTSDDLTMYFGRDGDIYKTTRPSTTSAWTAPTPVGSLNTTTNYEKWADVCSDGYAIVSRSTAANGQDLFDGTIATGATNPLTAFNSANAEQGTLLSSDCLRVYFQSNRDGQFNIYSASRASASAAWGNPAALPDFNTATFGEEDPWISTDQRTFVYASNSSGDKDLYISNR